MVYEGLVVTQSLCLFLTYIWRAQIGSCLGRGTLLDVVVGTYGVFDIFYKGTLVEDDGLLARVEKCCRDYIDN